MELIHESLQIQLEQELFQSMQQQQQQQQHELTRGCNRFPTVVSYCWAVMRPRLGSPCRRGTRQG